MRPAHGTEVTLTSGHTVVYLGSSPDGRMKVRSTTGLKIEFETRADRLPTFYA